MAITDILVSTAIGLFAALVAVVCLAVATETILVFA
jgi:biopolymer transport protein ExbB/TolQ